MTNDIETKLIKKAIKGNSLAFEKLIIPYEKKVYNIALRMFKNEADAYDASQEVFIKIYKNLNKFQFKSAFSTWLHRIAMNTCIDEYRKRKRHIDHTTSMEQTLKNDASTPTRQFEDKSMTIDEKLIQKEVVIEVQEAISFLKEEQKLLIIYRDIEGYSYNEIAEILECNLGTVKSRLSRSRQALKDIIIKKRQMIIGEPYE